MPRRHRRFSLPVAVAAILIGVAVAWFKNDRDSDAHRPPADDGQVVAVIDGDTIGVMVDGKEMRVRLYGIDAPEKAQPFGDRAKRKLSELVFGRQVQLEESGRDRYGRTVARIHSEGRDINVEMVRDGMAWWYREFAPGDRDLQAAEHDAQTARYGLWQDVRPVAPWEWRKSKRTGLPGG